MHKISAKFDKYKVTFYFFQARLFTLHGINILLDLAKKQIPKTFLINGKREGTGDELLYRSIIYTLFYANFLSVALIAKQEKLEFGFDFVDVKLILRSVIERCITQKYILTDPQRLACMFLYWGSIENKRFHTSRDNFQKSDPLSTALEIDFHGGLDEWSVEKEQEYQEVVSKWEALVTPKQDALRSRTWSGIPLAEMAKQAGLEDIYKLTYRETSWYSHGLIKVSDFFLHITDKGLNYSSSTSTLDILECYLQTKKLFLVSFYCVNEALGWNLDEKLKKVEADDYFPLAWIWEFMKLYLF
jgi:hypothetical protein